GHSPKLLDPRPIRTACRAGRIDSLEAMDVVHDDIEDALARTALIELGENEAHRVREGEHAFLARARVHAPVADDAFGGSFGARKELIHRKRATRDAELIERGAIARARKEPPIRGLVAPMEDRARVDLGLVDPLAVEEELAATRRRIVGPGDVIPAILLDALRALELDRLDRAVRLSQPVDELEVAFAENESALRLLLAFRGFAARIDPGGIIV